MKKILFSLIVLLATTSIFAQEPLMKVYLQDGSYKTYNINDIEEMEFSLFSDEYLMCLHKSEMTHFYSIKEITKMDFDKGLLRVYKNTEMFEYFLSDIDSLIFHRLIETENDMVLIPAGTFQMGNTGTYFGANDEKPVHTVTISKAFYMSKYEVTQKQYEAVMGTNPSHFNGENLPVEKSNWYDAVAFCNALSQLEGLTPCYTINGTDVTCNWEANGYRLPTEAEWEYACKAGTKTDFYNGSLTNDQCTPIDANLDKIGWYCGNSSSKTQPVGQKQPNAFGLYDMCGNVAEWCWDWYSNSYYGDGNMTDPKGPSTGFYRIRRGGSWFNSTNYCTSSRRTYSNADIYNLSIGFRLVRLFEGKTMPIINSIEPNSATIGDTISIFGLNFGSNRGSSYVSFTGTQATEYTSWNETEIKVKVPTGAKTGKLFVNVGEQNSNEVDITINTGTAPTNDMVLIPAGTFQMGNTGAYSGDNDEKPVHTVTISKAFYMSKYEVTQKQYQAVIGTSPSHFEGENLPVERVSWYDAVAFCNALSQLEGLTPCYTINGNDVTCNWEANGYRLPTEAEWEYAAKAGTTTDFYSGNLTKAGLSLEIDPNLDKIGWYGVNSGGKTQLVGKKEPNDFGLYDMSGNVLEWCWDWIAIYTDVSVIDPKGPTTGPYRVVRGGGYRQFATSCRSAGRGGYYQDLPHENIGFRIVRVE